MVIVFHFSSDPYPHQKQTYWMKLIQTDPIRAHFYLDETLCEHHQITVYHQTKTNYSILGDTY